MDQTNNKDLPWQITAKKLIYFASKFKNTNDEFERQVGYLLLDVGVETLFRVFITQPGIEAKLGYAKRDKIAKGTVEKATIQRDEITLSGFDELAFHKLTDAVNQIAGEKVNNDDLKKVEYFHNIRNKIYHLGDGIVPNKEHFVEYLELAQSLLNILLGVARENQEQEKNEVSKKIIFTGGRPQSTFILDDDDGDTIGPEPYKKEYYEQLEHKIAIATEIFRPEYATRIFEGKLKDISWLYDEENQRESQEKMKAAFNKLTGKEIGDDDFIEKCVNDVTFLRLNALRKKLDLEKKDIETYLEFKKWTSDPIKPIEEFNPEDVQRVESLDMWAYELETKMDETIESFISKK